MPDMAICISHITCYYDYYIHENFPVTPRYAPLILQSSSMVAAGHLHDLPSPLDSCVLQHKTDVSLLASGHLRSGSPGLWVTREGWSGEKKEGMPRAIAGGPLALRTLAKEPEVV